MVITAVGARSATSLVARGGPDGQWLRGEREDRRAGEGLARVQFSGREAGLVRRVREVLGLERVGLGLAVNVAAGAYEGAVEEVAGVELHARLVGPYGQLAAAGPVERGGGQVEAVHLRA